MVVTMKKYLERLPCEKCGSSDGIQVVEQEDGSIDGFCFVCDTFYANPRDGRGPAVQGERKRVITIDPCSLPVKALIDRGIRKEICEVFGVRVAVREEDGKTPLKSYYPDTKSGEVCGWEVRNHEDKQFYASGDRKGELELWGTPLAKKNNGRKLFITEGRIDAMSLYQALIDCNSKKYSHLLPSVVSLTRGASGALKDIIANRDWVESFGEIVLVFDNDSAGNKALKEVLKTFPLFKVATLPVKDANDMLMAGREKELFDEVMWNAKIIRQGETVEIDDIIEQALIRPKMGIETPWPSVTKLIYGFRPHTIHIVGAAPKIGKSDHEYQILHHLVYNLKVGVGVFDLENPPAKTAKKIASKADGVDYTRPDSLFNTEDLRNTLLEQRGFVKFYDRGASREWDDIRVAMEEMHQLDGINFFVLDPITALISRYTSSEANDRLNEICTDMADFVHKFPVTLFNYSHVNPKPKGSKAHEDGARVLSSEFTGSRAMEKWFHYGWGLRRNRGPDCPPEEQNVSYLDLLFDRDFGNSGTVTLYFNKNNMSYLEM